MRSAASGVGVADAAGTTSLADVEAGLDALETQAEQRRRVLAAIRNSLLPIVTAIALIIGIWELIFLAKIKPDYVIPSPLDAWRSLMDDFHTGQVWPSVGHSVEHAVVGFLLAVVIGTPLGLLIGRVRLIRTALGPIMSGLQSLPSVAWVPISLMLFGPNATMIYFVMLLGAVPSIAMGLVSGLDQVPPLLLRVGRNLGARGLASARHVLLPGAFPGFVAGLKQGWAFAWRSLMAAEIVAQSPALGHSLGFLLKDAQDNNDMGAGIAAIVLILIIGIAVNALVFAPLERRVLRSRGLALPGR